MLKTIVNAWKVPDVRKKLLFTALIILIFRIGSGIPVPFVLASTDIIGNADTSFLAYLSMFNGTAFRTGTLFALSISPYINASIIMQLLTVAIPVLERLNKDDDGRKKIASITRYVTVGLALLQATGYFFLLRSSNSLYGSYTGGFLVFQAIVIILSLTAGAALIMWLGEQINDHGIGNGISIILFAGIISGIPMTLTQIYEYFKFGYSHGFQTPSQIFFSIVAPLLLICLLAMIAYIVFMDNAERRIPIQYAKRVVGRKMYGGQNTHIPIKVNMSGVMPIIFASSILSLPATVQSFVANRITEGSGWDKFFNFFSPTSVGYGIIYFVLILLFAYFYASIQYNPIEMANNIRKNSGAVPGIRPGKPTSDFLAKVISRMVLIGALMLCVIALFPNVFAQITNAIEGHFNTPWETLVMNNRQEGILSAISSYLGLEGKNALTTVEALGKHLGVELQNNLANVPADITQAIVSKASGYGLNGGLTFTTMQIGGTSIIILVGVALETVKQLESQMMMRHYKGFLD